MPTETGAGRERGSFGKGGGVISNERKKEKSSERETQTGKGRLKDTFIDYTCKQKGRLTYLPLVQYCYNLTLPKEFII